MYTCKSDKLVTHSGLKWKKDTINNVARMSDDMTPSGATPLEKISKNVDFGFWGKQQLSKLHFFQILAHCVTFTS